MVDRLNHKRCPDAPLAHVRERSGGFVRCLKRPTFSEFTSFFVFSADRVYTSNLELDEVVDATTPGVTIPIGQGRTAVRTRTIGCPIGNVVVRLKQVLWRTFSMVRLPLEVRSLYLLHRLSNGVGIHRPILRNSKVIEKAGPVLMVPVAVPPHNPCVGIGSSQPSLKIVFGRCAHGHVQFVFPAVAFSPNPNTACHCSTPQEVRRGAVVQRGFRQPAALTSTYSWRLWLGEGGSGAWRGWCF